MLDNTDKFQHSNILDMQVTGVVDPCPKDTIFLNGSLDGLDIKSLW